MDRGTASECPEPIFPECSPQAPSINTASECSGTSTIQNTVVIALKDERYDGLIVEVADPNAAVELGETSCRADSDLWEPDVR